MATAAVSCDDFHSSDSVLVMFREEIVKCLHITPLLLAKLMALNLITDDENVKIHHEESQRTGRAVDILLQVLIKDQYSAKIDFMFIEALNTSEHSTNEQLAEHIKGNLIIPRYDIEHRLIKKHSPSLVVIDASDMVPYLPYIPAHDGLSMIHMCSRGDGFLATSLLLHYTLRTRDPEWFETFLTALEENKHGSIATKLRSDFDKEKSAIPQPSGIPCIPIKEEEPLLYEDQKELAEDALNRKNTVLVAPTGSGKTHVAAYIIHDHFIKDQPKPIQERCVLFLVTTISLVEQQKDKLKNLLKPASFFSVVGIYGASELRLHDEVTSRKVIVLTAQILENALGYIPLDSFSLLVFDECHLCQKEHAYNAIMTKYLDEKDKGNANLPQIVGMTASLGTGKAKYSFQARQHAVEICSNMGAHSISMVIKEKEILSQRVNIPHEVEPIEVHCRPQNPFADKVNEIMEQIEGMLKESSRMSIRMHMKMSGTVPQPRGSQSYRQWCDKIRRGAQRAILHRPQDYRVLQTCMSHLLDCNTALLVNKEVRTKDAYNFLCKMIDKMDSRMKCFDANDLQLWTLFKCHHSDLKSISENQSPENPLLEKLCQIIEEEYKSRPESRAILFVKTIESTQALQEWITETPQLSFLNAGRIAGSRDMNSSQQNKVMNQFRSGAHKMLVATNLLEQGTDVPACNLVIRLDYVPSDFGHVQIKGRTRAPGGRSYLITLLDSNASKRDFANRQRECMMISAAESLKQESDEEFLRLMKIQQALDRGTRQSIESQKKEVIQANEGLVFAFLCGNCAQVAFESHHVAKFSGSMYIVLDPGFSKRFTIKPHPKPTILGHDRTKIGKLYCKQCEYDWGSLMRGKNLLFYPTVKISKFCLRNVETSPDKPYTYKKWKRAPFAVQTLRELPQVACVSVPADILKQMQNL